MSRHKPIRILSIVVGLFVIYTASIATRSTTQATGQELRDIPIALGGMAFNEIKNRGFDIQQVVTWEAKDIEVTTGGAYAAQFKTRYKGPRIAYPVVLDVLFVQFQAVYAPAGCPPGTVCAGDFYFVPLDEIVPIVAKHSALRSARFIASGTFDVPAVTDRGSRLSTVWLNLTWVRVYDAGDQLGFHVFPGFEAFYSPDTHPRIGFDQQPQSINGRLGYYQVLLGRGGGNGVFNYQKWIRQYLRAQ